MTGQTQMVAWFCRGRCDEACIEGSQESGSGGSVFSNFTAQAAEEREADSWVPPAYLAIPPGGRGAKA